MLQKAYDWIVSYSNKPSAIWVLALVSFAESSICPIPPLPLLIPMCLANPRRAWFYAGVCAVSSAAGGYAGYAIGYFLYETLGRWIIEFYGLGDKASELEKTAQDYWIYVLVTKGLTPIPFKIVTIMSGFIHFNLVAFTLGSLFARFTFFMLFAVALRFYGDNIRIFIERHLKLAAFILLFFLVGGFVLLPHLIA